MRPQVPLALALLSTLAAACAEPPVLLPATATAGFEVVERYPHDAAAFTQGLAFYAGQLYEGTGRYGQSTLRRVRLETGEVLDQVALSPRVFGEGIAIAGDRIYQLTWMSRTGFVYDLRSLQRLQSFRQVAEGWGLTYDGRHLVQSDGTATLRFLDPDSLLETRRVQVRDGERSVTQLNELEAVQGEIWANVWHSDSIVRIDPADGRVKGRIDLGGLLPAGTVTDPEAVLNGIAYDAASGRLFVTGKLWPWLFEVRVVAEP